MILVLRPEPGATATVRRAAALGLRAVATPLFTIRPVAPDRRGLPAADALLLTSANAARALGSWPAALRALPVYAVGAATAAAARAAGFERVTASADDADAIVARAAAEGVGRLLHLAGREHRAVTHDAVAIERRIAYAADEADDAWPAIAAALRAGAVPLLHSPRAAALLARRSDEDGLARAAHALAALSPAVAAAAGPGWRTIAVAEAPTDAALLAAAARLCDGDG